MQHAMQHQDFNLFGGRVSEVASILGRDLGGDGNLARELFWRIGARRKRQYVGGFVFSAETAVQRLHLRARSYKHVYRAFQPCGAPDAREETGERQLGKFRHALLKDDQSPSIMSSRQGSIGILREAEAKDLRIFRELHKV